jgi:superoxide dismutase
VWGFNLSNLEPKISVMSKKLFFQVLIVLLSFTGFAQVYTLPHLPYALGAYDPFIDAQTMEIHHGKHHAAYVNNLNKAISGTSMEKLSMNDLLMYASFRSATVRNNAGGHYNHSLFWDILAPKESQRPISKELQSAIDSKYTSIDSLIATLNKAASTRFGSGWAWLVVTPQGELAVYSTANQDNPIMDVSAERGIPILGIDVWEHAYYLKYQNRKADYLSGIWNLINWGAVSEKYAAALNDPLLKELEKDNWLAIKDFHKVMAQTFHPAEEKNFAPLRSRSGELYAKAILLKNSIPPASANSDRVQEALTRLEKQCLDIHQLVQKPMKDEANKDALLLEKITKAHDIFHEVEGLCHD